MGKPTHHCYVYRFCSLAVLLDDQGERLQHHGQWDLRRPADHEEDLRVPHPVVSEKIYLLPSCSFSSHEQMLTYSCHIWECHRADVHKIVARLHISQTIHVANLPSSPRLLWNALSYISSCGVMQCTTILPMIQASNAMQCALHSIVLVSYILLL